MKAIAAALLLSTACGVEGVEVRHQGEVLDVLHTARYAVGPRGRDIDFRLDGDRLILLGQPEPYDGQGPVYVRLVLRSADGPAPGLYSPGPALGHGLWLSDEGVEIAVDAGGELEIEGRLRWSGPVTSEQ